MSRDFFLYRRDFDAPAFLRARPIPHRLEERTCRLVHLASEAWWLRHALRTGRRSGWASPAVDREVLDPSAISYADEFLTGW